MEDAKPRARGRPPKKSPKTKLPETEGNNMMNDADERTETSAENNGSDSSDSTPIPASEDSTKSNNTSILADSPASPDANDGLPSLPSPIAIQPRKRPRKGIPVRSPFF